MIMHYLSSPSQFSFIAFSSSSPLITHVSHSMATATLTKQTRIFARIRIFLLITIFCCHFFYFHQSRTHAISVTKCTLEGETQYGRISIRLGWKIFWCMDDLSWEFLYESSFAFNGVVFTYLREYEVI